jgi:hypothetical protein
LREVRKAKLNENIEKLLSLCKVYLELNEAAAEDDAEVKVVRDFVPIAEKCILGKVDYVTAQRNYRLTKIMSARSGGEVFAKRVLRFLRLITI